MTKTTTSPNFLPYEATQLASPGELPVLGNYHDVLAPLLGRAPGTDLAKVFSDHTLQPLLLFE